MPVSTQEKEGSGAFTYASRGVEGKAGEEKARENLPLEEDEPEGRGCDRAGGGRERIAEVRRRRREGEGMGMGAKHVRHACIGSIPIECRPSTAVTFACVKRKECNLPTCMEMHAKSVENAWRRGATQNAGTPPSYCHNFSMNLAVASFGSATKKGCGNGDEK